MSINASGWRPEAPVAGGKASPTVTGNKGLMLEEALIFEIGDSETTGVDFATAGGTVDGLGSLARTTPIGLPQPPELRHRPRFLPARIVHDEAQSAPQ